MATFQQQLTAGLAGLTSRQPFWKTKKDDFIADDRFKLAQDGNRRVLSLRIVVNNVRGQVMGQAGPQFVPMAHFRILLVVDDDVRKPASVELNSTGLTVAGGTKLVIASHDWVVSAGPTPKLDDRIVSIIPGVSFTVNDVLNLLVGNKRHHYKLHHSGSGCRYWTQVVLGDLVNAGYLPPGSDGVVESIMRKISRERPDVLMLANANGEFF